jgi:hypothetical protein
MSRVLKHVRTICMVELFRTNFDKPYSAKDITNKLLKQWKTIAPWKMISLGKGFYEFSFASFNDL